VKDFWKWVKIWRSGLPFGTQCSLYHLNVDGKTVIVRYQFLLRRSLTERSGHKLVKNEIISVHFKWKKNITKVYYFIYLWPHADIIFSSCGFFLLSYFRAYSQPPQIGCLPYFHTWCGLSANVECRSEMCYTRLAENTGRKRSPKTRHLGTIAQLCRAVPSQLKDVSTIGKAC